MVVPLMTMNTRRPVKYVPPSITSIHSVPALLFVLLILSQLPITGPIIDATLLPVLPRFVQSLFRDYGRIILPIVIIIHVCEVVFIALPMLKSKNVAPGIAALWVLSSFIEGYYALMRLNLQPTSSNPMPSSSTTSTSTSKGTSTSTSTSTSTASTR